MENAKDYFVGLDMGTNSIGWAVTWENYEVVKKKGKALWGIRLFDEAKTAEERRQHRVARRMVERRARRIDLLQELFAEEICKVDPGFYHRLNDSNLYAEDKRVEQKNTLFNDVDFDDKSYHKKYPTIYHLRYALMNPKADDFFDIREVYLAIHHILKHRGHFLFDQFHVSGEGLSGYEEAITELEAALFENQLIGGQNGDEFEADIIEDKTRLKEVFQNRSYGMKKKSEELCLCFKQPKNTQVKQLAKLLSGSKCNFIQLFGDEALDEFKSISFRDSNFEEKEEKLKADLGERFSIIDACRKLYDWGILSELLGNAKSLSEAKIKIFEKHKKDLAVLKKVLKSNQSLFTKFFRSAEKSSYGAYVGVCKIKGSKAPIEKKVSKEEFCDAVKKAIKTLPESEDKNYILIEIENGTFMPKAVDKENSVIPYQLHQMELEKILKNAKIYFPFLNKADEYGTVADKIISLFTFRIPYYVGPLNSHASTYWAVRKEAGKVYPWNFEEKVDVQKSAEGFIRRMTNKCTYLLGEDVLPKNSLLYSEYMVLNELNNIRIGKAQEKLSKQLKKNIIDSLFKTKKHVTKKAFINALIAEGIAKEEANEVKGLAGEDFKSNLAPWIDLKDIPLSDGEKEIVIENITLFGADKTLLKKRLQEKFPTLSNENIKELSKKKYEGWGRLSRKLLTGIYPTKDKPLIDRGTGEVLPLNIISALRETNYNLMELLSNQFGYMDEISKCNEGLVENNGISYSAIQDMWISPSVRRPLWQALRIVKEITEIMGNKPSRIFIEMARGPAEKKITKSRKETLVDLYKSCKEEELKAKLETLTEADLRSDRLYLYYTQLGKSMYTGKRIDIENLYNTNLYDIDHIYPQSLTGDDSLSNRVLVEKVVNSKKGDQYPLGNALNGYISMDKGIKIHDIQGEMRKFWSLLHEKNLISDTKYQRLIRTTPLTEDEKADFIGRQLVETRQSTKACAEILKQAYPETEIVYVKAGNVSAFRKYGDFIKVRAVNDFHHGKDAYLNIVVGNVFHTKFTANPRNFFNQANPIYTLNPQSFYSWKVERNGKIAWDPGIDKRNDIDEAERGKKGTFLTVEKWLSKNNLLFTKLSYEGQGGLFDQNLMQKGKGQVPIKLGTPVENIAKYGGYNKATITYLVLMEVSEKGKRKRILEALPLYKKNELKTNEDLIKFFMNKWADEKKKYTDPKVVKSKIRIQSLLEINGFKVHITGKSGNQYVLSSAEQLCLSKDNEQIIRNVVKYNELFNVKKQLEENNLNEERKNLIGNELTKGFDILLDKMKVKKFYNRFTPIEMIIKNQEMFKTLTLAEKAKILIEILYLFQCNRVISDLSLLGGSGSQGAISIGKNLKESDEVILIEQSVTGFYEKRTMLSSK